ncbi:hypothetical protein ABTM50_21210, partial [Acinetobacter baumannii]
ATDIEMKPASSQHQPDPAGARLFLMQDDENLLRHRFRHTPRGAFRRSLAASGAQIAIDS